MTAGCSSTQVVPRSGGPSAKTFHRTGSPNLQNASKEKPMVGPLATPARLCGRWGR